MITYSMLTPRELLTSQVIQRYPDIDASELWCAGTDCIQTPPLGECRKCETISPTPTPASGFEFQNGRVRPRVECPRVSSKTNAHSGFPFLNENPAKFTPGAHLSMLQKRLLNTCSSECCKIHVVSRMRATENEFSDFR